MGELEGLLSQLQYVSNAPGPPLLDILSGMNFEDDGWFPVLHRLASSTSIEAYGQASAPSMVDAQRQSDDNSGQFVSGFGGMRMLRPVVYECGWEIPQVLGVPQVMLALVASAIPVMPHASVV